MSVETVLDRGSARGRSIWPAFQYQVPGLLAVHVSERAVFFGVYSGAYLHGYNYLREVAYETLAQMVIVFDQAMAELDADEQRSIIDIAAKRYVEDQALAAKDAALLNKQRKVGLKTSEVDAKISALESDREALETKRTELEVARSKTDTLIKELEAKIEEQKYEGAQVDAEIARQQLLARKAALDVVETGIRALEIQSQIADAAYRLASVGVRVADLGAEIGRIELDAVEVDVRISQTEADTARLKTQKETESLVESELSVARAETDVYSKETGLLEGKETLLDQRITAAETEIGATIPKLAEVITKEKDADLASQEAKNQHQVSEYENRKLTYDEKVKTSKTVADLETANYINEGALIDRHANDTAAYHSARVRAAKAGREGAEQAALIIAFADITSTLTHQISSAKGS